MCLARTCQEASAMLGNPFQNMFMPVHPPTSSAIIGFVFSERRISDHHRKVRDGNAMLIGRWGAANRMPD
jgi:hypothetical protein